MRRALLVLAFLMGCLLPVWAQAHPGHLHGFTITGMPDPDGEPTATVTREFWVYVPTGRIGQYLPVVAHMHGRGGYGPTVAQRDGIIAEAEARGYLLVIGQSYEEGWNFLHGVPPEDAVNAQADVRYWDVILNYVTANYRTSQRLFGIGMSQGGMMTYALLCGGGSSYHWDAIVTHSSTLNNRPCLPQGTSLLHIHGYKDGVVPFLGGVGPNGGHFLPVLEGIDLMAQANGCPTLSPWVPLPPTINQSYATGCNGLEFWLVLIRDGQHVWFGPNRSYPNNYPSTRRAFDFFDSLR